MTIREFFNLFIGICNKLGNWFVSLTLWEFFICICLISIFIFCMGFTSSEEN